MDRSRHRSGERRDLEGVLEFLHLFLHSGTLGLECVEVYVQRQILGRGAIFDRLQFLPHIVVSELVLLHLF